MDYKKYSKEHYFFSAEFLTSSNFLEFCESCLKQNQEQWFLNFIQFALDWLNHQEGFVAKTSGTTGKAKRIEIKKKDAKQSAHMTCKYLKITSGMTALLALPLNYIAGKMMFVRALEAGLNLHLIEPKLQCLNRFISKIDFTALTPYQVENALHLLELSKVTILGGSKVQEQLKDKIVQYKNQVFETFGATETISHFALKELSKKNADDYFHCLENISVTTDQENRLIVDVPYTDAKQLLTNDIVELKDNKTFRWLGRYDNIINSGGIKISPEEIENVIEKTIKMNCIIFSKNHQTLGEQIVMVYENTHKIDQTILNEKLMSVLDRYLLPKQCYYVNAFSRNANNKILREATIQMVL